MEPEHVLSGGLDDMLVLDLGSPDVITDFDISAVLLREGRNNNDQLEYTSAQDILDEECR